MTAALALQLLQYGPGVLQIGLKLYAIVREGNRALTPAEHADILAQLTAEAAKTSDDFLRAAGVTLPPAK